LQSHLMLLPLFIQNKTGLNLADRNKEILSIEVIYSELYSEMRRVRDHQITIGVWYTTTLLAVSSIFAFLRQTHHMWLVDTLEKWSLAGILFIFAGGIYYLIWYEHTRYCELRKCVESIELEWKVRVRKPMKVRPPVIYTLIIGLLTSFIVLEIWRN